MEELHKDYLNSWLRRTRFSKTVNQQPNPSQIPIITLIKLKLESSNPSTSWASISKRTQTTTLSSLKSNNPDSVITDEVVESDSKTKKNNLSSVNGAISDMYKGVKKTVRSRFVSPPHRKRIMKCLKFITQRKNNDSGLTGEVQLELDSKTEKNNLASVHGAISDMFKEVKNAVRSPFMSPPHIKRTVKSFLSQKKKSQVHQVGALDRSSEDEWTPDILELIRWKEMASRVRCPIFKEDHVGPRASGLEVGTISFSQG